MSSDAIEVKDLVVHRAGKKVLHGISFSLKRGVISALLGANGAGKSSTVMALAGALPATSGSIRLGSFDLLGRKPDDIRRRGIALVPEGHRVLGQLSVLDNLLVAIPGSVPKGRMQGEVERVLEIFPELKTRLNQRASDLSGGQKQMVAMGQAFIAKPDYMIVDELSLGLAPTVVRRLAEALRHAVDAGIGVLLIEQFAHLALELASEAMVLERGRMVFTGTSETLKADSSILHSAYLAT